MKSACQSFSEESPAGDSRRSDPAEKAQLLSALPGPDGFAGRLSRSTPLPTCSLFLVPLAAVEPGPDVDAFTGGVVTVLSVALIILALLGGLSIVRRIFGS